MTDYFDSSAIGSSLLADCIDYDGDAVSFLRVV